MITSPKNPKIQWVRDLQQRARARRDSGAFVVEGVRLVEESAEAGLEPQLVLYSDDLSPRGNALVERFKRRQMPVEEVDARTLRAASETQTPQGLLAVLPLAARPLPPDPKLLLVLDAVRDPGNLGAILRTAAAAGADGALLAPGTADAYAPKVVRAAMGAHFRLPVLQLPWDEIAAYLQSAGSRVFLAAAGSGVPYTQADFRPPMALIVGGEAEGAGPQAMALADETVRIPMPGRADSLNAAVAAGILLFEMVRGSL